MILFASRLAPKRIRSRELKWLGLNARNYLQIVANRACSLTRLTHIPGEAGVRVCMRYVRAFLRCRPLRDRVPVWGILAPSGWFVVSVLLGECACVCLCLLVPTPFMSNVLIGARMHAPQHKHERIGYALWIMHW